MTPVLWWNYPVWGTSSVLTRGPIATYVRQPPASGYRTRNQVATTVELGSRVARGEVERPDFVLCPAGLRDIERIDGT